MNFFVLLLIQLILALVLLVDLLQSSFSGFIYNSPFLTNDLGDLGTFGIRILGFHIVIDLLSKQEESRERLFRGCGLNKEVYTFPSLFFFPILYSLEYKGLLL